jgi:endonuclease YncB( thermonuclease family)
MRSPFLIFLILISLAFSGACARRKNKTNSPTPSQEAGKPRDREPLRNTSETKILRGLVIGITDGDTVEVLDEQKQSYKIRLKSIDAPERLQTFGNVSRQHLAELLAGKPVLVEWRKHDRYGRIVGRVVLNGQDVCLEQIKAGMAWHFKYFENEQSETDRVIYANAESEARSKKVGLWQEFSPIPPWDFRVRRS